MESRRTLAQWFCLLGGGLLLVRGVVGFALLDASFDLPGEGWHHLIHLVSGAALLLAARLPQAAAALAVAFGLVYGAIALAGIVDGDDVVGLIAADAVDKTFHTVLGLTSLAAGIASLGSLRGPAVPGAAGSPE
jgi:hypothetical protein